MTDNATSIPFARLAAPPVNRRRVLTFGLLACVVGLFANAIPAYFIFCLLQIPAGSSIRPMMEVALIFLGSLGGLAVGVPLGVICWVTGRRWWAGWMLGLFSVVLSLSAWFVSNAIWHWVVAKQGFVMEP
jgi:hypothetical protein